MKMRVLKLLERVNVRISEFGSFVVLALAFLAMAGVVMQLTLAETVEAVLTNF